jgi:hypothetical protein
MNNTLQSIPKDGQFVIIEDASGDDAVVRWSSHYGTWVDLTGAPTSVRPARWSPIPKENVARERSRPQSAPLIVRAGGKASSHHDSGQHGHGRLTRAKKQHSLLHRLSLALFAIVAGGSLLTIVFRGDLVEDSHHPEQQAVLEATRQYGALEPQREDAQDASHDVLTTQGVGTLSHVTNDAGRNIARGDEVASRGPEFAPETVNLLERASRLLQLGDIGAARLILALAHDKGSAPAAFMLAETYNPLVLATWNVAGTRADAVKARALYARAYAGGIIEAKERLGDLPN